jgi:p-hydroxybenzoate 3-monooxygenase
MLPRMTTQDGGKPTVGPILNKNVTAMRSFVTEPMSAGRLYLAGDAAHIVPPTGAKGLNLAASDVLHLARVIAAFYATGKTDLLNQYSDTPLKRVWRSQRFSWWMTQTLHRFPEGNSFDHKRQLADLDYIISSKAALTSLAENYVGLPTDLTF